MGWFLPTCAIGSRGLSRPPAKKACPNFLILKKLENSRKFGSASPSADVSFKNIILGFRRQAFPCFCWTPYRPPRQPCRNHTGWGHLRGSHHTGSSCGLAGLCGSSYALRGWAYWPSRRRGGCYPRKTPSFAGPGSPVQATKADGTRHDHKVSRQSVLAVHLGG